MHFVGGILVCLTVTSYSHMVQTASGDWVSEKVVRNLVDDIVVADPHLNSLHALLLALQPRVGAAAAATRSDVAQMQTSATAHVGAEDELTYWEVPAVAARAARLLKQPRWQQHPSPTPKSTAATHDTIQYWEAPALAARAARKRCQPQMQEQQPSGEHWETQKNEATPSTVQYWDAPAIAAKTARMRQQPRWQPTTATTATKTPGLVQFWEAAAIVAREARKRQQSEWQVRHS